MDGRRLRTASGTAVTEFLLVALPLLAMGLGAFDVARWHLARQTLSHALLEAGRAGAVHHGDPLAIQATLQRALAPLQDAHNARALRTRYGLPAWRIEVLGPTAAHFADFPGPPQHGMRTIRHSYQHEQHLRALARGHPEGRGPASGDTIFQANTLTLRVVYLHTPLAPGMRSLVRMTGQLAGTSNASAAAMRIAGVIPVQQSISVPMQSAPWEWAGGRPPTVITPPASAPAGVIAEPASGGAGALPPAACTGSACASSAPPAPGAGTSASPPVASPGLTPENDQLAQACAAALCCPPDTR